VYAQKPRAKINEYLTVNDCDSKELRTLIQCLLLSYFHLLLNPVSASVIFPPPSKLADLENAIGFLLHPTTLFSQTYHFGRLTNLLPFIYITVLLTCCTMLTPCSHPQPLHVLALSDPQEVMDFLTRPPLSPAPAATPSLAWHEAAVACLRLDDPVGMARLCARLYSSKVGVVYLCLV